MAAVADASETPASDHSYAARSQQDEQDQQDQQSSCECEPFSDHKNTVGVVELGTFLSFHFYIYFYIYTQGQ